MRGSLHCGDRSVAFGRDDGRLGKIGGERFGGGAGAEVGGGDLEAVEEDAGAFEVHLIGGDAGEDVGDGFLDGVAVLSVLKQEGVVREDLDALDAVMKTGELVAHGVGAATDSFVVRVNALVRLGRILLELWIEGHMYPPGGYIVCC
jgi:hypothetical protein